MTFYKKMETVTIGIVYLLKKLVLNQKGITGSLLDAPTPANQISFSLNTKAYAEVVNSIGSRAL